MEYLYRIRQKSTNMYSNGGRSPRFTKQGKWWSCEKNLKAHLNMKSYKNPRVFYETFFPDDWEIVKYKVEEVDV